MFKAETTLIPSRVRHLYSNIEGFRQVAPLGDAVELSNPETGTPGRLLVVVHRAKNTGTIVVTSNITAPHHKERVIPQGRESSVHVGFFNHPEDAAGRVETFLDALQSCYIYKDEDEIAIHKDSMLGHILNNETAYLYI